MNGLLRSRKFWLAVFGCVQAIVLHYLSVPDDIWQTIAALVGVVIAGIAVEDHAEKSAGYGTFGVGGRELDDDEDSDLYEPVQPTEQPAVGFYAKTNNLPY